MVQENIKAKNARKEEERVSSYYLYNLNDLY